MPEETFQVSFSPDEFGNEPIIELGITDLQAGDIVDSSTRISIRQVPTNPTPPIPAELVLTAVAWLVTSERQIQVPARPTDDAYCMKKVDSASQGSAIVYGKYPIIGVEQEPYINYTGNRLNVLCSFNNDGTFRFNNNAKIVFVCLLYYLEGVGILEPAINGYRRGHSYNESLEIHKANLLPVRSLPSISGDGFWILPASLGDSRPFQYDTKMSDIMDTSRSKDSPFDFQPDFGDGDEGKDGDGATTGGGNGLARTQIRS